jgi:hypothetical protein
MDLIKFIEFLWDRKFKIVVYQFIFSFFVLVVVLILPKEYESNVVFLPPGSGQQGALAKYANLASAFGINLGGEGISPFTIEDIIKSPDILNPIIFDKYNIPGLERKQINLIEYFEMSGDSLQIKYEKTLKLLINSVIKIYVNPENFTINLSVRTRHPEMSYILANKLIQSLENFYRKVILNEFLKQSRYVENKIDSVTLKIKMKENELKHLLEESTQFNSPSFQIKLEKLKKEIELNYLIKIELLKQKELYNLNKISQLAPLKIITKPQIYRIKVYPKRLLILLLTSFGFFVILVNILLFKFYYINLYKND